MLLLAGLAVGLLTASAGDAVGGDRDCSDFATQQEAQNFFESHGPGDPHGLDSTATGLHARTCPVATEAGAVEEATQAAAGAVVSPVRW